MSTNEFPIHTKVRHRDDAGPGFAGWVTHTPSFAVEEGLVAVEDMDENVTLMAAANLVVAA